MPKALSFTSKDEIVAALKERRWEGDIENVHQSIEVDLGPLTAIYTSVGSSTYRSFPKHRDNLPSAVFRGWASAELFHGAFARLSRIQSNGEYRNWAFRLAKHLDSEWLEHLRYELHLPRALKLVNLLAKGLCVVTPLWPNQYKTTAQYLDVPLDQLSCLSWKWRKRSSVKITERTYEERTEAFHPRRKSSRLEAASCGQSTRLGTV